MDGMLWPHQELLLGTAFIVFVLTARQFVYRDSEDELTLDATPLIVFACFLGVFYFILY